MLSNEIQKVTGHTTFVGTHSKEMKHLDAKPQYKRLIVKHMLYCKTSLLKGCARSRRRP